MHIKPFAPCLFLLITACATTVPVQTFEAYLNDPKAHRLAVQVCLPDKTAFFDEVTIDVTDMPTDITFAERRKLFIEARQTGKVPNQYASGGSAREYQVIRQWRAPADDSDYPKNWIRFGQASDVKGVVSDSSGTAYLSGSTESNQAVFFSFTHERPEDIIAAHLSLVADQNGKAERRTFWFKPPKGLKPNVFTDWMVPLSEEGPQEHNAKLPTFWLLTHGKEMPIFKVGQNAPRIRYMLLSKEQFYLFEKEGRRTMDAARLQQVLKNPSVDNKSLHFIPQKHASIPAC